MIIQWNTPPAPKMVLTKISPWANPPAKDATVSIPTLEMGVPNVKLVKSRLATASGPEDIIIRIDNCQCDEEKPKCRACTQRNTPCTYSNEGLDQLASAASVASSPYEHGHGIGFTSIQSEFGNTPLSSARPEPPTSFSPIQPDLQALTPRSDSVRPSNGPWHAPTQAATPKHSPLTLNMAHLELLHHFITVTAAEMTAGNNMGQEIWHMTIPKIALSHEWLMHGILAVSALHMAYFSPGQQSVYWKRAALHQDQALQG